MPRIYSSIGVDRAPELWRKWLTIVETSSSKLSLKIDNTEYEQLHKRLTESCRALAGSSGKPAWFRELGTMIEPYPTTRALALADAEATLAIRERVHLVIDELEGRRPRPALRLGRLAAIAAMVVAAGAYGVDRLLYRGSFVGRFESWVSGLRRSYAESADLSQLFLFAIAIVVIGVIALSGPPRR